MAGFILSPVTGEALDFPKQPITLICGHAPGGSNDIHNRVLAEAAKKYFSQNVVPTCVTGGGGSVAISRVVNAKPDGYSLCYSGPPYHRISFWNKLPFSPLEDTTPIIQVWGSTYSLIVRGDSPFKDVKDLVAYAKANPKKLKYMTAGIGSGMNVIMLQLQSATGIEFTHVPGKGEADAVVAVLGGHVDMMPATLTTAEPHALAGNFRILLFFTEQRTKAYPDIPTAKELGYNIVEQSELGIHGPKGLPEEIVKALHDGFKKAMFDPIFVSHCKKTHAPILYLNTADYQKLMRTSYGKQKEAYERIVSQLKK